MRPLNVRVIDFDNDDGVPAQVAQFLGESMAEHAEIVDLNASSYIMLALDLIVQSVTLYGREETAQYLRTLAVLTDPNTNVEQYEDALKQHRALGVALIKAGVMFGIEPEGQG